MATAVFLFCGCENGGVSVSESSVFEENKSEFVTETEKTTEAKKEENTKAEHDENENYTDCTKKETSPLEENSVAVTEEVTEADTEECNEESTVPFEKEAMVFDKKIALTFDDGPSIYTEEILNILETYGCRATFFVVGSRIEKYENILKKTAENGHEIGCHTWSHKRLTDEESDEIEFEINMTRDKILAVTGSECFIVRPPYGAWDENLMATGERLGVAFVNWSVDTLDWKTKDAKSVYDEIMKSAKDGRIILCHDLYPSTVEAVEKAIPMLMSEGYEFVTVSELLTEEKVLEAGKIYYKN